MLPLQLPPAAAVQGWSPSAAAGLHVAHRRMLWQQDVNGQVASPVSHWNRSTTSTQVPSPCALQGHRPGAYVRLRFSGVPCELVTNFDPRFPILVGSGWGAGQAVVHALGYAAV